MKSEINVVFSAFDGMSCGQIALKEIGIIPKKYYASEIDESAIQQTQFNFPNTIQLGDIRNIDAKSIEKVDLFIGGSPCANFSFAGKRAGMSTTTNEEIYTIEKYLELKNSGFKFVGQSYLFWEYIRILNQIRETNPDVKFFLENVQMGEKWYRVLSDAIGTEGVFINSALVSAQTRKRIYWTNIKSNEINGVTYSDIPQPEDMCIYLDSIINDSVDEKYYINGFFENESEYVKNANISGEECLLVKEATKIGHAIIKPGESFDYERKTSKTRRGRKMSKKSNTVMGQNMSFLHYDKNRRVRKFTPKECSMLQGIPKWYKWKCSESKQYKMIGKGWNIPTITHIFSFL